MVEQWAVASLWLSRHRDSSALMRDRGVCPQPGSFGASELPHGGWDFEIPLSASYVWARLGPVGPSRWHMALVGMSVSPGATRGLWHESADRGTANCHAANDGFFLYYVVADWMPEEIATTRLPLRGLLLGWHLRYSLEQWSGLYLPSVCRWARWHSVPSLFGCTRNT